jgi:hypothetical protein
VRLPSLVAWLPLCDRRHVSRVLLKQDSQEYRYVDRSVEVLSRCLVGIAVVIDDVSHLATAVDIRLVLVEPESLLVSILCAVSDVSKTSLHDNLIIPCERVGQATCSPINAAFGLHLWDVWLNLHSSGSCRSAIFTQLDDISPFARTISYQCNSCQAIFHEHI